MTARTPIESLTLAVYYLDWLLDNSEPGPWMLWNKEADDDKSDTLYLKPNGKRADGALVVALHATAPAIRELLAVYIDWLNLQESGTHASCLGVAEALLSTPHASQWITEREAESAEKFPKPSEGSKPERLTQPLNWANVFVKPEPTPEGSKP